MAENLPQSDVNYLTKLAALPWTNYILQLQLERLVPLDLILRQSRILLMFCNIFSKGQS